MSINLIGLDMDGTLISMKHIHFTAINKALTEVDKKYVITEDEHFSTYDGKSTSQKLVILNLEKGLPHEYFADIRRAKQNYTREEVRQLKIDERMTDVLRELTVCGYKLVCFSNAIKETTEAALRNTGLYHFFNFVISATDVSKPKPSPLGWLRAMQLSGCEPQECLLIEDSPVGKESAIRSGAHVMGVRCPEDVTFPNINNEIVKALSKNLSNRIPWIDSQLTVLMPIAGGGRRFAEVGFELPKPLIPVRGHPMVSVVLKNLNIESKFVFIVQQEHCNKYNLNYILKLLKPTCELVALPGITEGAAATSLCAIESIDNDQPLLIVNGDQFVPDFSFGDWLYKCYETNVDGSILTFKSNGNPKWSYAKVDENGWVAEVAEKKAISNIATVGAYYFKKGSDYVKYAKQMIAANKRTNGEFYICPVFNEFIADGKKISIHPINEMFGIGTPEDLSRFLHRYVGPL